MNYIPENPYRNDPDYLTDVVCADEYKFELVHNLPTLRCYNKNKQRTDVLIEVEYPKGIEQYTKLPLGEGSLELLAAWFAMQDEKPF